MLVLLSHGCKGGVGKSVTAVALANAFKSIGMNVGLLDADIDSPNLPAMFGRYGGLEMDNERYFVPMVVNGIPVMSAGIFMNKLWASYKRGNENRQIIRDMLLYTRWGNTQMLVVDCPAGFSDETRAVIETVGKDAVLGTVLTTLPTTLDDLKRSVEIFSRIMIRVLGVVENMKGVTTSCGTDVVCKKCGSIPVFFPEPLGASVSEYLASAGIALIAAIPLIENFAYGFGTYPFLPGPVQNQFIDFARNIVSGLKESKDESKEESKEDVS